MGPDRCPPMDSAADSSVEAYPVRRRRRRRIASCPIDVLVAFCFEGLGITVDGHQDVVLLRFLDRPDRVQ